MSDKVVPLHVPEQLPVAHITAASEREHETKAPPTPLEVMIENMNFWRSHALTLGEQIAALVVDENNPASVTRPPSWSRNT